MTTATAEPATETVTEMGLVKIGRSGRKVHAAQLTYEITNPGTTRERKRLTHYFTRCQSDANTCGGHGRLGIQVVYGKAEVTCEMCKARGGVS